VDGITPCSEVTGYFAIALLPKLVFLNMEASVGVSFQLKYAFPHLNLIIIHFALAQYKMYCPEPDT